jgi:hypothetical protein
MEMMGKTFHSKIIRELDKASPLTSLSFFFKVHNSLLSIPGFAASVQKLVQFMLEDTDTIFLLLLRKSFMRGNM